MGHHGFAQGEGGVEVVAVVAQGNGHAFAHSLQAGEVDHRVKGVFIKNAVHGVLIAHVRLIGLHAATHDFLHAPERLGLAVDIVVHHHHIVSRLHQLHAGMRRNEPGAAGQQNSHESRLLCFINRAAPAARPSYCTTKQPPLARLPPNIREDFLQNKNRDAQAGQTRSTSSKRLLLLPSGPDRVHAEGSHRTQPSSRHGLYSIAYSTSNCKHYFPTASRRACT